MKRVSAPCAPSIDCLTVLIQTRSIPASNGICELARLQPPSLQDRGLQVHLHTHLIAPSKYILKLTPSQPPSASPNLLDHCLQVHLQTRSITAFKYISTLTRLLPPSSHYHGHQVHLLTCSVTASECISEFTRSSLSGAPQIDLHHHLQPVQIYCV